MISEINVPLEVAVLLCAACCGLGVWLGRISPSPQVAPRNGDPLDALMQPTALGEAISIAVHRNAMREATHAVLHGRIDQMTRHRDGFDADLREEVRGHVAAVMRTGLRRTDRFSSLDDGNFTITIPGADETAAMRIANRLRTTLSQLRLTQLGKDDRVTASFGVAAHRHADGGDLLNLRARRALQAAINRGQDHVIAASEIEEVLYLPPPSPNPAAEAA